jgi:hypothetical protein
MVREAVAMSFIARMGEAASRESFARVFINGDFQGVYAVVEEPNTGYLKRRFGKDTGALFEYHWVRTYDFSALGDRLDEYELLFERRTHESESAAPVYEPLQAMIDANSYPIGTAWRERIEAYLDLPQMIRYAAIEAFLGEIDGFTGYAGVNNFYVYRPDGSTRHIFLPWDRDHTMWQLDISIFERVNGNRLLYNALAHSDLRALYLDTIERCAKSALEDKWLEAQASRLAALVDSAAPFDTRLPYAKEKHDGDVANVIDFAQRRSSFVLKEVACRTEDVGKRVEGAMSVINASEDFVRLEAERRQRKEMLRSAEDRVLDPWERYRAVADHCDRLHDVTELYDRKTRFALIILGTLNAMNVLLLTKGDVKPRSSPAAADERVHRLLRAAVDRVAVVRDYGAVTRGVAERARRRPARGLLRHVEAHAGRRAESSARRCVVRSRAGQRAEARGGDAPLRWTETARGPHGAVHSRARHRRRWFSLAALNLSPDS